MLTTITFLIVLQLALYVYLSNKQYSLDEIKDEITDFNDTQEIITELAPIQESNILKD